MSRKDDELIKELKPLLNSGRIERLFGNCTTEVLFQENELRISNLYSKEGDKKTMRTCAIVTFSDKIPEQVQEAHKEISRGGSIGSTLKSKGFLIIKQPVYFGNQDIPESIKQHMDVDQDVCAVHIYQLKIENIENQPIYCTITEIHHPDYLTLEDLKQLYPDDYPKYTELTDNVALQQKIDTLNSKLEQHPGDHPTRSLTP